MFVLRDRQPPNVCRTRTPIRGHRGWGRGHKSANQDVMHVSVFINFESREDLIFNDDMQQASTIQDDI